jgi:hypothetical protein
VAKATTHKSSYFFRSLFSLLSLFQPAQPVSACFSLSSLSGFGFHESKSKTNKAGIANQKNKQAEEPVR